MKKPISLGLSLLVLGFYQAPLIHAETAPPAVAPADASLLKNGSMELDANADGWPDGWQRHKDATWVEEGGKHFIRLKSPSPGATVLLFQKIPLSSGTKGLEMKWRVRATDLKPGAQTWFDARILLEFRDAADGKLPKAPNAPYLRKSTTGWEERSVKVSVPDGAASFVFMPSLFQVETGTLDLDDFSLTVIDAPAN
ncbi:MAG: hypothetical protein ABI600_01255 [Luteolibacter sp.]